MKYFVLYDRFSMLFIHTVELEIKQYLHKSPGKSVLKPFSTVCNLQHTEKKMESKLLKQVRFLPDIH